jgi:hypothetical protein
MIKAQSADQVYANLVENGVNEVEAASILNNLNDYEKYTNSYNGILDYFGKDTIMTVMDDDGNFRAVKRVNGSSFSFEFCGFDDPDAAHPGNGIRVDKIDQNQSLMTVSGLERDVKVALRDPNTNAMFLADDLCPGLRSTFDDVGKYCAVAHDEFDSIRDPEHGSLKAQIAENTAKEFDTAFVAMLPWLMAITIATQAVASATDDIYDSLEFD